MQADRLFIIAPNVDDSLKRFCPSYDIQIFSDFTAFEQYVETTPDIVHSVILTDTVLQFTGSNMQRLMNAIQSPFLTVKSRTIYLYGNNTSAKAVKQWTDSLDGFPISTYQGVIDDQFIIGIVNGKLRDADEEKVEEVTYRYRRSEYVEDQKIQKYETDNNQHYKTDEEELAGIPDVEEPEFYTAGSKEYMVEYPIVGLPSMARSVVAFIEAQYLSLSAKTIVIESDSQYHRLTDIVLKSGIEYDMYTINDLINNVGKTINEIKTSKTNLIVIGCTNKIEYSYTFVRTLLADVLKGFVQYFVYECDFKDTPYNANYAVVFDDTMPDVLKTVENLLYPVDIEKNVFVGVRYNNWQPYYLTTQELEDVLCNVLTKRELVAQTITINGSTLKKENSIYDLLSIIGRGNRRQVKPLRDITHA